MHEVDSFVHPLCTLLSCPFGESGNGSDDSFLSA